METNNKTKKTGSRPSLVIEAMAYVSMAAFGMALVFFSSLVIWSIWQNVGPSQWLIIFWVINIIGFVGSQVVYSREVG